MKDLRASLRCARACGARRGGEEIAENAEIAKESKLGSERYCWGMYDFAGKSFCSRLRDFGCPDTLIKDVRDVAAAVMCSEGQGRKRVES
jgi:hypothetical protein